MEIGNESNVVAIAMVENIAELAEFLETTKEEAHQLRSEMQKFMRLWIATKNAEERAAMDEQIVTRFDSDMPADTARLQLRDLINSHAVAGFYGVRDEDGELVSTFIPSGSTSRPVYDIWFDAGELATCPYISFRLCKWCGTPFQYKSKRAKYCSNACRVAASRANK